MDPEKSLPDIETGGKALVRREPLNLTAAMDASKLIAVSGLCPQAYRGHPEDVLVAILAGDEVGLTPFASVQNIAVIGGRATLWGDVVLGLVHRSGLLTDIVERDPQEALEVGEGRCEVRRGAASPVVRSFSMAEAEKAGLIRRSGPSGPWSTYPGRMLQMRARSWALRDVFPDVLKGIHIREEVEDLPPEANGEAVAMPRKASEAVEDFLGETAAPKAKTKAGKHETKGAPSETKAVEGGTWFGAISKVTERSGETRGKAWVLYTVHGADGAQFSTFSGTHRDHAESLIGSEVQITFSTTPKGGRNIELITERGSDV